MLSSGAGVGFVREFASDGVRVAPHFDIAAAFLQPRELSPLEARTDLDVVRLSSARSISKGRRVIGATIHSSGFGRRS